MKLHPKLQSHIKIKQLIYMPGTDTDLPICPFCQTVMRCHHNGPPVVPKYYCEGSRAGCTKSVELVGEPVNVVRYVLRVSRKLKLYIVVQCDPPLTQLSDDSGEITIDVEHTNFPLLQRNGYAS